MIEGPVWLVGCGNMGGAMLRGWLAHGLDPASVTVIDPRAEGLPAGVRHLAAVPPDGEVPAFLMLAVKPQMLDQVTPAVAPVVGQGTLLASIMAGVETASLAARFPGAGGILRIMPNTPAAIGKGVIALRATNVASALLATVEAMMGVLGIVEWLAEESHFDIVTALSGSGPAFTFRFMEALAAGSAALGLPIDQALRMARATVEGSAMLAMASDETPFALAEKVASPGGSTREGLNVLDRDDAFRTLIADTLSAAHRRNQELAAAAR
jgi:pyrroline-5-carboxylate reductase